MNKIILLLLVSILCLSSCSSKKYLTLGSDFKGTKANNTLVFIPNGALVNSFPIVENDIEYTVGVLNDKIVYIGTSDKNFTISGLKTDDLLPESYFNREWGYRPGWGYYMEIESGWYAGFDFQTKPTEESRIQWFFKFNFNK